MNVFCPNDINIYDLSGGKNLPDFLSERKRRDLLRKDVSLRRRIDLIQDFDMPTVNTRVHVSNDGQYVYTSGTYKPRIKCFEVSQLSLKFERCVDMEVQDFLILSDDYQKIAILGADRTIELHTSQGKHAKLRVPKFGRELGYYPANSELLVACAGSELYRLSLEEGRFLSPYTTAMNDINSIAVSDDHYLVTLGGNNSMVECWDPRARSAVGCVKLPGSEATVTKVTYLSTLQIAAGTSDGRIVIYDLRQTRPLVVKDHMYEKPINQITKNHEHNWIISTCQKSMKIWEADTGKAVTAVEPPARINDAIFLPNTGLTFLALEQEKMQTYFIPTLGPAPRWCSFLDCLTEELEETKTDTIYDNYKFLTEEELKALSLHSLIGTNLLRAYMHGYFIDHRLYQKAKIANDPFVFEKYKEEEVEKQLKKDRKRAPIAPKVDVNSELYLKLKSEGKTETLEDDRFNIMFKDPEMVIDKENDRYKLLKPVSATKTRRRQDSSSEEDESAKIETPDLFEAERKHESENEDSLDDLSSSDDEASKPQKNKNIKVKRMDVKHGIKLSSMYDSSKLNTLNDQRKVEEEMPLGKRISTTQHDEVRHVRGGKIFQIHSKKSTKSREDSKDMKKHVKERRTNIRNAESLLKKHKPKNMGK